MQHVGPEDLAAMKTVLAVADAGSMTGAADQLGRSTSSVSREISALERRLGVRLLVRTSRGVRPTEIGSRYVARARDLWEGVAALHGEVRDQAGSPVGLVRVTAVNVYGAMRVVPVLAGLVQAHPALEIDLELTDRPIDLHRDRVDVAVRHAVATPTGDVVARWVAEDDPLLCAAPAYLSAAGPPGSAHELARHELIVPHALVGHDLLLRDGDGTVAVPMRGRFTPGSTFGTLAAVRAGAGIGRFSREIVADDLEAGRLVEVLAGQLVDRMQIYVVTLPGPRWTRAVRTVVDALVAGLSGR